jgi:hypothetical protein
MPISVVDLCMPDRGRTPHLCRHISRRIRPHNCLGTSGCAIGHTVISTWVLLKVQLNQVQDRPVAVL